MATAQKLMTVEEFERLPDPPGGEQMELVRGVVTTTPPAGTGHGERAFEIGALLARFVDDNGLGDITGVGGYLLSEDPDIVRAPDTAWLASDRVERESPRKTAYFKGAPDLAVEVVSEDDRDVDIADEVEDYLRFGSRRVWVVRPRQRTVTVHRPGAPPHVCSVDDALSSDDAGFPVQGFELKVATIFE